MKKRTLENKLQKIRKESGAKHPFLQVACKKGDVYYGQASEIKTHLMGLRVEGGTQYIETEDIEYVSYFSKAKLSRRFDILKKKLDRIKSNKHALSIAYLFNDLGRMIGSAG